MTVAANNPRVQPTTDGVTTAFVVSYAMLDRRHLRVYVDDDLKVEGADYALSGLVEREGNNGYEAGFTVTMATPPAASETLTIYRDGPETQETRYYVSDPFLAEVPERTWDKLTMLMQELSDFLGNVIKKTVTGNDTTGDGSDPVVIPVGNAVLMGLTTDRDDGTYNGVEVEWDGFTFYAVTQPIISTDIAEINGCPDPNVGDVVIAFPFTNDQANVSYRFDHAQPCIDETGGPDTPEQSSPFYLLEDCASVEADIVTSANLTRLVGDVVLIAGVCYTVSETEDGTGAVTGVAIGAAWSTCGLCSIGNPDPKLPELPNIFAQMARCSDDVLVDLWLPEVQFGLPGDEDLTKIYSIILGGECYYVSNERAGVPGTLFPSGNAFVYDSCAVCLSDPCVDCPGNVSAPKKAVVTNVTDAGDDPSCTDFNADYSYTSYSTTASLCIWRWDFSAAGQSGFIQLFYAKGLAPGTGSDAACRQDLVEGEAVLELTVSDASFSGTTTLYVEKTTSYSCDPATGRISLNHTFAGSCTGTACAGAVNITVLP